MSNSQRSHVTFAMVLLCGVVAGSWLIVNPAGLDAFQLPKLWLVVVAALGSAGMLMSAGIRRQMWPPTVALAIVGGFGLALMVAVATSESVPLAILGPYHRLNAGLLYGACMLLYLLASVRADVGLARALLRTMAVVGALVSCLALAEGVSPWFGVVDAAGITATQGNPNFVAGLLAVGTAASMGLALDPREARRWRVAALVAVALTAAGQGPAASLQGPLAAAAALWLLLGAWWLRVSSGQLRRPMIGMWLAVTVLSVLLLGLGFGGIGPLAALTEQGTLETRLWYWSAALSMLVAHPLLGVGLGGYGAYFRIFRPDAAVQELGLTTTSDAAHNVVLELFASGGLPLGLAYVAVLAVTVAASVVAWRRMPEQRALVAAVGAAWLSYQVQAAVSVEIPALAVTHWVLAGLLLGMAWAPSGFGQGRRTASMTVPRRVAIGLTGLVLIGGLVAATRLLVADMAAGKAAAFVAAGQRQQGADALEAAVARHPWEARYRIELARLQFATGRVDEGYRHVLEAARLRPRWLPALVTAARAAAELDREGEALGWYGDAVEADPHSVELRLEAGKFAAERGRSQLAVQHLSRALRGAGEQIDPLYFLLLAEAHARLGQTAEAVTVYERLAAVHPGYQAQAAQEITRLKDDT